MSSPLLLASPARRLGALLLVCLSPSVHATPAVVAGDLSISRVWARATVPGVTVGAVYLTIENRGGQADTLLGASSPAAHDASFHVTTQHGGMSHMAPVGDIAIAAGQSVKVEPSGLHLMLTGLKQPLVPGTPITVTLRFQRAGGVTVIAQVIPLTAAAPATTHEPGKERP